MTRRLFLVLTVVLFVAVALLPLLTMLIKSLFMDGKFTPAAYDGLLKSAHQWTLMGHSTQLATLVTVLAVGFGVPLGLILGKTDLPWRKPITAIFVIPLLIPPYIIAVSWSDLLGAGGLLAQVVGAPASEAAARLLFGLPGCVFILMTIYLPIPILLTMVFSRTINPWLEEAGRLVTGWRGVLLGITVPLILPGILLSALLVFLLGFGEFSVPNYLRYDVFPVESFTQFSAFYDFKAATAAASPLVAVTLILLMVEAAFLRDRTGHLRPAPGLEGRPMIKLGKHRWWLFALVLILAVVIVVVPIAVLAVQAGGPDVYAKALDNAGASLWRSLAYAAVGATLLSALGFVIGYLVQRRALECWRWVDSLTLFLLAVPGTVVGIGLISLWNRPHTNFIYGTPLIIILGYLAKYTALTSRITATQLEQIPASMEEAAQVAGAGWLRRMTFIVVPLARRGLVAGWLVGYVFSLRDMGITMLVYPPGKETLPVRIFTLMANGSPELIAALCMIMITATLLPVALLWGIPRLIHRKVAG